MDATKILAAEIQPGDRFLAGPQGPSPRRSIVRAVAELVSPVKAIEVHWVDRDEIALFRPSNRLYVERSTQH